MTACACCAVALTPLEREHCVEGMCAECAELSHELPYYARSGIFYGDAPCEMTTSAGAASTSELTTVEAAPTAVLGSRQAAPSSNQSSSGADAPASSSRWWMDVAWDQVYFVALALAVAVFCWRSF